MQVCETAVHLKMFNAQKTSLNSVKLSTQKAKGTWDWAKGHLCNLKSILLYVCTQHDTVFSHYSKPIFVSFCFVFLMQDHPIQSTSLAVCSISKMIFWFILLFTTWPQTAVSYSTPFLRDKLLHRLVSKTPQPSLQQHLPKTQFRGNHLWLSCLQPGVRDLQSAATTDLTEGKRLPSTANIQTQTQKTVHKRVREASFSEVVRDLTVDVSQTSVSEAGIVSSSPGQHSVAFLLNHLFPANFPHSPHSFQGL